VSAFFPLPFYPAKILAIARDYPLPKFVAAVILARIPGSICSRWQGKK
jgi:hypothetical protein